MKAIISKLLQKHTPLNEKEILNLIEVPKSFELGDYAFPCFALSKKLQKNPNQIAEDLKQKIKLPNEIEKIEVSGAYLNFFVNQKIFTKKIINEILKEKDNFGKNNIGKGKKVIVEFSSPNIAKPFGIGHLRSTIIGNSLANIYEARGFDVIKMNYFGDWGTQFGKLILGYKKFGDETKLKKDPIKHLLEIYVKISGDEKYDEESRKWFKKLEEGDKGALNLWNKFKKLSLKDFEKIYKILGVTFDIYDGESNYNKEVKKVLKELQNKKILERSEGALVVDLKKYNLGVCLIQKSDGAALYTTRDIASAISRHKKYKFVKMIYEVGQEQKLHFNQVFKILELMGYEWAKDCVHTYHGLYLDEDGRKFATRKGKTIFMEDILNETKRLSSSGIKVRLPKITKKDLEERSVKVAKAAIFYGDLKNNRTNDIVFDLKRFVSFEGDTGPYLLYSYARANSIIKKAKTKNKKSISKLEPAEIKLTKKLSQFPDAVLSAYKTYNPSLIANYSYGLAQIFNEFYHACSVINSDNESLRLNLVKSFKIVLKNSLNLLGIETLEEM